MLRVKATVLAKINFTAAPGYHSLCIVCIRQMKAFCDKDANDAVDAAQHTHCRCTIYNQAAPIIAPLLDRHLGPK